MWLNLSEGGQVMMGRQTVDQSQLFYLFNLEQRIPFCEKGRARTRAPTSLGASAHRVRSPDLQTAENCQMCQFNGGSSTHACGQIDSYRFPHDLHGPHSSQSNTKTSRDWLGIEMGDQSGN
jgi:hypothetical protein